jgi:hypothetical protein
VVSVILHGATTQIPRDYWIAEIPIEKGQKAQPRTYLSRDKNYFTPSALIA